DWPVAPPTAAAQPRPRRARPPASGARATAPTRRVRRGTPRTRPSGARARRAARFRARRTRRARAPRRRSRSRSRSDSWGSWFATRSREAGGAQAVGEPSQRAVGGREDLVKGHALQRLDLAEALPFEHLEHEDLALALGQLVEELAHLAALL